MILYDAIVTHPDKVGHGVDGYYFGENGEHPWYDISKAIGEAMVERGLSKTDEPTTFTDEELVKYSRSLGWKPKLSSPDMVASIDAEMEAILKQKN